MVFIVFRYIKVTLKGNRTIFAPLADPIRTNFYVLMFVFFVALQIAWMYTFYWAVVNECLCQLGLFDSF